MFTGSPCVPASVTVKLRKSVKSSDPSLGADLRSLPLAWDEPLVPRQPEQVTAGHLQVPLVPGEDLHAVLSGAAAQ